MPELPEVETMVRGLRPVLVGRRIETAEVVDEFLLQGVDRQSLEARLGGALVEAVDRRGKWVVIGLGESRGIVVIQPRMTGGFWLVEPTRPEHVKLKLQVGEPVRAIWYCDARRLGRIAWYPDPARADVAFTRSHGPDALTIDRDDLAERLHKTGRPIKPTLMDQKVLAGIGNIYADEVLFRAKVHPSRIASSLASDEIDRIHTAIPEVLRQAIAAEGSSFDAGYRTVLGLEGGFLAMNALYGREGEPCRDCGEPVLKIKLAGLLNRPTYVCARCQPNPNRNAMNS